MSIRKILLTVFFICLSNFLYAQTKHALIVAIGNYPKPEINNWDIINSVHDVPLIKNALLLSQQFSEKNIQVLLDSAANKNGILGAIDKLYGSVNKGDIVVIHFSSTRIHDLFWCGNIRCIISSPTYWISRYSWS